MVRRRIAALLLVFALAGSAAGGVAAAGVPPFKPGIPTLKPNPPVPLPPAPAPKPKPAPTTTTSTGAITPPTPTQTVPTTSLPMTGANLALELSIAGGLLALGLLAHIAGRRRRHRVRG